MRSLRNRTRGLAVAGLALLAVLASGCAREPGVVAYVDGTKITQQQLDQAVDGVGRALSGQQISPQAVTSAMIHGILSEQIAAKNNLAINDAERDALLKGSQLAPLLTVPEAKPLAYDLADQEFVVQKLGEQAYLAAIGPADVELNPRFGVLDQATKTIVDGQSGGLAKPVPAQP